MSTKTRDKIPQDQKIQPKLSFLTALWISLLIVLVILSGFEIVSKKVQSATRQPVRSIGNFHTQFETKWFKLKDYVKSNGGVDVLLLGNSMVNTGIDPEVLVDTYQSKTGQALRIFNFGVEGMDLYTNAELAELLVAEFHPKTVIFFTEMREYGPITDPSVPERYKTAAWFQYKLGTFSLEAWTYDHSAAMQYFLPWRNWSRADFPDTMLKNLYRYNQTTAAGYEPDRAYGKDLDVLTDPNDPEQKVLFDRYNNFTPDEESLADFARIVALEEQGVQVFVTEMPVYRTFYDYFGGEAVHQDFLSVIKEITLKHDGVFINPIDSELIPLIGRVDDHHLNFEGAPVYSELLGTQLGELCLAENECLATGESAP